VALRRFELTSANVRLKWKRKRDWIKKYPKEKQRSAVIPVLWLAQEQNDGWVSELRSRSRGHAGHALYPRLRSRDLLHHVPAQAGGHPKFHVQVCGTTPCMLRGSES
jgi:NADH-quinone oxidoreductase subunit E